MANSFPEDYKSLTDKIFALLYSKFPERDFHTNTAMSMVPYNLRDTVYFEIYYASKYNMLDEYGTA